MGKINQRNFYIYFRLKDDLGLEFIGQSDAWWSEWWYLHSM